MGKLVLVRHGQSQWNLENKFTGWVDVPITEKGEEEARKAAVVLKDVKFDMAFTSELKRAHQTLDIILEGIGQTAIPITRDKAINERHYGDLQGLNKDETREKFGKEQVHIWRRSYDVRPPNGECLKDTAERAIPYFEKNILPPVMEGKNAIVAAHGNSLRAIVMDLDKLSKEEVLQLNIATGTPITYEIDADGKVLSKSIADMQAVEA
jgi:2,3-bisphosphoglycerate-dependent phosphoglycerate mutase